MIPIKETGHDGNKNSLMTVAEVARILHVHPNTVRIWSNSGVLPGFRVGPRGDRRFRRKEVIAFLKKQ
jgi:excisionase family DNA binding protein